MQSRDSVSARHCEVPSPPVDTFRKKLFWPSFLLVMVDHYSNVSLCTLLCWFLPVLVTFV